VTYSTEFSQSLLVTCGYERSGLVKASCPPHNMLFIGFYKEWKERNNV